MKKIYCILTTCLFCLALTAQNVTEKTKKEMNRIKLSRSYICAEATMPTLQEAIDVAKESLIQSIEQWAKEEKKYQGAKQIALQDINSCIEKMDMKRGKNVRALVYIKKKDIIPIYGNGQILLTEDEQEDTATAQQPIAEEPQLAQVSQETDKPSQELLRPVRQEQPETTPKQESRQTPGKQKQTPKVSSLQRILAAQTMNDIKVIFHELKKESVLLYGKYNSTDLDISNCCLLFYNRQGQVTGILGEGLEERVNLRTNQQEPLTKYNGNAAYWFILTNE
ncbi:hypothetical protein NXV05_14665 [Parabacteroides johnsonii]|jgi:hypothetical protein|uniref:hypothetical protein n=1 Tax=Parabacteroides johnsonii TaxID=387661 RepID=UPI002166744B|nr:hypothetical protein [Parabacteroides johnsonii]MCS3051127.1 hypothetical protein [Parabacteroides johnsonii]